MTVTSAARAPSITRASRGIIDGYAEMSTPRRSNAQPGTQKSRCMSTTRNAVCAGSTSSESSVKTCLPSISIIRPPFGSDATSLLASSWPSR